jgi:hypothetical protein
MKDPRIVSCTRWSDGSGRDWCLDLVYQDGKYRWYFYDESEQHVDFIEAETFDEVNCLLRFELSGAGWPGYIVDSVIPSSDLGVVL